ncbi:hypothetical protein [Ascidiimonas sp. W6]|uniref:hypothetical protein n=1 Tax=Ascidiimonas meishanensis TaxID=3128903 RepID=UPI0030EE6041
MFIVYTYGQDKSYRGYLAFQNYDNKKFPVNKLNQLYGEALHFFSDKIVLKYNKFPGTCLSPTSRLYNFLIEEDVISGYVDIYEKEKIPNSKGYLSREDFVKDLKKEVKLYFVGSVAHDTRYKAYIFKYYKKIGGLTILKELMVNIKDNHVTSILVFAKTCLSDFGYKQFTIFLGENEFIHKVKTLYSDVIGVEEVEEEPIYFRINSEGFVIVQE